MKPVQRVEIFVANSNVIKGRSKLAEAFQGLKGKYIVEIIDINEPETEVEWQNLYFYLRDLIYKEADTGYTKVELHEEFKKRFLPKLPPEAFKEQDKEATTTNLTPVGWQLYIQQLKEFVQDFWGFNL